MEFMKQVEQRTEAARAVPKTEFDIDFHLYRKTGREFQMSISIEKIVLYVPQDSTNGTS